MRLITLGDSLTATEFNWAHHLSKELNCELINFGIIGCQNILQVQILQRWLLDNELKEDDIVIWQIGISFDDVVTVHPDMHPKVKKLEQKMQSRHFTPHCYFHPTNKIDKQDHISLLFNSPLHKKHYTELHTHPEANVLQSMLFMFLMIKKMCPRLLIIRGGDFVTKEDHWENMKEFFNEKNIDYIDQGVVSWCMERNLQFLEDLIPNLRYFHPKGHPTNESSNKYVLEEMIPKLKSLNWI